MEFVKTSKLIHKLQGFVEQYGNSIKIHEQKIKKSGITEFLDSIKNKNTSSLGTSNTTEISDNNEEQTSNPLMVILNFLECLKSRCVDGRICILPAATIGQGIIKFLLLNPATHFHDIGMYTLNTYLIYIHLFHFYSYILYCKTHSERCQISGTCWWHNGANVRIHRSIVPNGRCNARQDYDIFVRSRNSQREYYIQCRDTWSNWN